MNHKSTILIVDDEAIGRETLEEMLLTQGYNLAFASTGAECLEKAADLTPDVILLDVMMPGMDGFEVCRQLRMHPLLADVPIILVTALDDRDARLAGIEAGADDFISKPVDRVELRARLRTITRLNRYRHLLAQRARFTWVTDQAEDAYLILNDEDEILYANSQARLYLGVSQTEDNARLGRFLDLVTQSYQCTPSEAWADWPQPTALTHLPRYLVRPETPTTNVSWLQVDLMDATDKISDGHLVRLRDVTTNVVEERLQWSFHAQISHKLKTPLTHLIGSIELLMNENEALSEEQKTSFISLIYQGCEQLRESVNSMFQYLESHDIVQPGQSGCNLTAASKTINKVAQDLELNSIDIVYDGFTGLDDTHLSLSLRATEMIFWELLKNAKKFHPQQIPTLVVKFTRISSGTRIQICDDGLTLSPEQLSKIWLPYYQAEKYFTGQVPGMGLGLSAVAALISSVGGTYRTYNDKTGPGVVIELVLPVNKA